MTVHLTIAPPFPLLYAALWVASVAAAVKATCLLAVFALTRREELQGRVLAWQGAACGLASATLFSAGTWQAGALFAVTAVACGVLWRRERSERKREVTCR